MTGLRYDVVVLDHPADDLGELVHELTETD
jgi:hypothetical protein